MLENKILIFFKTGINYLMFKVCFIFCRFLNFKFIGALTSKPFAFKAWSWELNSSYIVDLTNPFHDKLRVDSKGIEIVRIIPWLTDNLNEQWISDKARFSYDGLNLNRIANFFFRRKNILYPLIYLLIKVTDPIFQKYFEIFFKNLFLDKILNFKSKKENIYLLYFSFFKINFFFKNLFLNYFFKTILSKEFPKFSYIGLSRKNFNFKIEKIQVYKLLNYLKKFFFLRRKKLKIKNNNFYFKRMKILDYISIENVPLITTIYFSNFFLNKKIQLMLEPNFDFLNLTIFKRFNFKFLKKNNIKLKENSINFFCLNYKFFYKQFSTISSLKDIDFFDCLIFYNLNLRVVYPTMHVYIWKLVKEKEFFVINISAYENLLFKHLNLGNRIKIFNKLINGQHWINSMLTKKFSIALFFNYENEKFKNLYKFMSKINFFKNSLKKKFDKKKKNYFLSNFFFLPFSFYNIINYLNNIYIFSFKKKLYKSLIDYSNKHIKSNLILSNNILNNKPKLKNFGFYDKNQKVLIESNITNYTVEHWDIILPLTIITENFFLVKNYFNISNKSLFVKFGPWLARNFFNFFQFLFKISIFPFFFFKKKKFFINLSFFFLNYWLEGSSSSKKNNINEKFLPLFISKISDVYCYYYNNSFFKNFWYKLNLCNITKNSWYSELSFITSSKYGNLGYKLLKKENLTFK